MSFRAYKVFTTEATDGRSGRTDGVAVSSTTTYYSSPVALGPGSQASVSWHCTGTPTGTVTLWKANRPNPSEASDSDWSSVAIGALGSPAGAAANSSEEYGNLGAGLFRIKYVNASGSGVLYGYVNLPV